MRKFGLPTVLLLIGKNRKSNKKCTAQWEIKHN